MMDRKTLVLDPGHGGTTATGGSTPNRGIAANGLFEKDVALDLARRVRERLRTDFTVVLTRESDVNVALAERAAAARRVAADLFVSIHFSGTPGTQPSTSDVVTTSEPSAASTALARSVLRHVGEVTGAPGVLLEARLGQLAGERHDPKTAACLVEVASMDDPIQAERLVDDGYRDRLAEALARSIREASADTPTVTPQWVGSRSVARATAVVSPDIDYSVTSLADAGRIWLDWFARYGDWYRGVPNEILHYFPHAAICQLKLYGPNSSTPGFGTGFYIADEVLLTCGHNFFYPPHNFVANRVEVLPAYSPNMSILPAKEFAVSGTTLVHPRWLSSNGTDRGFDLAVLPVPGLPATAGTFSLPNMSLEPSAQVVVCGYGKQASSPNLTTAQWLAEMESQGQRMDGATITNVDPELAFYPIQTLGGHSGSPVFHESMLIAVHTGPRILNTAAGISISPHENRGVLLTPDKNDWIVQQAGGGVSIGLSAGGGRARALQVTSDSTQREQSDEVRLRIARSVGLAEAGGRYDLVHDDSNRINFGIGSWTGTRIADVLDTYAAFAAANGLTARMHAHFGGEAQFVAIRDRFRAHGTATTMTPAERAQLSALGADTALTGAQDQHLADDLITDLEAIGSDGPPWYPFIDGGMGAISEIAAHVLVHARHQAGGAGLHQILNNVTAHFGGEDALGRGMVAGSITERDVLDQIAAEVVARVASQYRAGVTARYQRLFVNHGGSTLSFYFHPE